MFRETQEDFLRYLLFDDQEDDIDFFNSNNNVSLMNQNNNMDAGLFNQNDTGIDPAENNHFSTNSVFNNNNINKVNEFDKQQDEINQQMTEMTLNNASNNYNNEVNNGSVYNSNSNHYRNNFGNNLNGRGSFVGNEDKYNGYNDIREDNPNQAYIGVGGVEEDAQYAGQINNNDAYYMNAKQTQDRQQLPRNISSAIPLPPSTSLNLNQSLYIQPAQIDINQQEYNNYSLNKDNNVDYDNNNRIGSPIQQQSQNRYQQSPLIQQQQQYDMISSPTISPANPYIQGYNNNNTVNNNQYYGQQVNGEQSSLQVNGKIKYYYSGNNNTIGNGVDLSIQQQPSQDIAYFSGQQQQYDNSRNQSTIYEGDNNNYQPQLYSQQQQNNQFSLQSQSNSIINNQQYPQNISSTPQSQQYSYDQNYQNNNPNNNANGVIYNNNNNNIINPSIPFYQNSQYDGIIEQQEQDIKVPLIGQVPGLGEMRKRKSQIKSQINNTLSKKSSSIKEQQQQKYEKKYQKGQQSQKLQQQISNAVNNQSNQGLSSSSVTLQFQRSCHNTESVNASQYSSTDNNMSNTFNNNEIINFNQPNSIYNPNSYGQQSNSIINQNNQSISIPNNITSINTNSSNGQFQQQYNGFSKSSDNQYNNNNDDDNHQHHHCCHDDDDEDESDQNIDMQNEQYIENQDDLRQINRNNNRQNSYQLNDSNSNDSKGEKIGESDQDGNSEKNSKADEIAILAESIKHCNKKNVVKNIMSAFLTFMNDRKNKIYTQQEQEFIPSLYYSAQSVGVGEEEDQIEEIRKKFKRYISQKSLNHYTVRLLILHPNYGPIFKHYLTNPIKKWINNSKVADLGAHIKMIGFFLACFQDNNVLEELKRHEKKRAHFS